ncbi:unnamed protein product, partial [Citrullus colocynthis]
MEHKGEHGMLKNQAARLELTKLKSSRPYEMTIGRSRLLVEMGYHRPIKGSTTPSHQNGAFV